MRTTRYTIPVKGLEDIRTLETKDYDDLVTARSVYDLFKATAALHPDRPGLTVLPSGRMEDAAHTRTNQELFREVTRVANMMYDRVTREGGVVAIISPNYDQIPAAIWGVQTAGVVSSINYLLNPEVIIDLLAAEGATAIVVPGPDLDPDIWEKVQPVMARTDLIKTVFVLGGAPVADSRILDFDRTLEAYPDDALTFSRQVDRDTVAALFHTGGTTGTPKLVQLTHGNQIHGAWAFAQMWHIDETDVVLNCLPMFHVGGTISLGMSAMGAGAHEIILSPYGLRDPDILRNYWKIAERYRATVVGGVPTAIVAISEVPVGDSDISSVRMGFTGGSICPVPVGERFEKKISGQLFEQYGMTETGAMISSNPVMGKGIRGSAGMRVPFSEILIADQTRLMRGEVVPCPAGEIGSVLVRGPQVFPGYKDERHNKGALLAGGWLVTGDLGYMNQEARLFLTGREKDLIIRSGHNIDPAAIEEIADAHPSVTLSAAVGMPDAYAGEVPILFVVKTPGQELDLGELEAYMRSHITEPPARPRTIIPIDEMPTTTVGKIFKPALRDLGVREKIRQVLTQYLDLSALAEIQTEKRKDGRSDVRVVITSRTGVDKGKIETRAAADIMDLPVNLTLEWK